MKRATPPKRAARKTSKQSALAAPLLDRRGMEQMTSSLTRVLKAQHFSSLEEVNAFLQGFQGTTDLAPPPPETKLERAQQLMYEAWDARGKRRVELAKKALAESPDCADAYVLLAEETAKTAAAVRDLYAQGVAAGERALGPEFMRENVGHFWGLIETRPYMRAREGLAHALTALGELSGARTHFQELLRLNPNDNQGIRYLLARCLLAQGDHATLLSLLDQFAEDEMAEWLYTRALVLFKIRGGGVAADRALSAALQENPYVPLYLLGIEKLPAHPPASYGFGDRNEAAIYVGSGGEAWMKTPGAVDWLAEHFGKEVATERPHVEHSGNRSPV